MKHHLCPNRLFRIGAALFTVIALSLSIASPALALDLNPTDYFDITFNQAAYDKTQVTAGEVFHLNVSGRAACKKDLPLPVSEVSITSKVVASPAAGGAPLVLNAKYVIDIKPLPNKAGQTFDINQSVDLQFPAGAAPGSYSVTGLLTQAQVKVTLVWIDVTSSFPREQAMGTVKLLGQTPSTSPAVSTPTPTPTVPVTTVSPGPPPTTGPFPSPPPVSSSGTATLLTVAVVVLSVAAIALIIVVIMIFRRRGT